MGKKPAYLLLAALGAIAMLFLAPYAFPQVPTPRAVTGHMGGVSGTPVAGTYIQFQLTNCASGNPRVLGYTGIVPAVGVVLPDDTGLVSGTIWANDVIDCGGTTGLNRWQVTNVVANIPQGPSVCYDVTTSGSPFNLDTATPASPCITTLPILPVDVTYHNLTLTGFLGGVNATFGGTVQAHEFLLDFTPTPCPSGQYLTGYHADLTVICAVAPVASVFGRTGPVVQVSGDYSCGQVTGAICSLPTLFYQTVKQAGTARTQRANLNFIGTGQATVTAVDNSGTGATDVTVSVPAAPTRTCNANGCYRIEADGTIEQWGQAAGCGSGGACATAVTFPTPFTTTTNLTVIASLAFGNSSWTATAVSRTTSGFSMQYGPLIYVGGSGVNFDGSELADWYAIGH